MYSCKKFLWFRLSWITCIRSFFHFNALILSPSSLPCSLLCVMARSHAPLFIVLVIHKYLVFYTLPRKYIDVSKFSRIIFTSKSRVFLVSWMVEEVLEVGLATFNKVSLWQTTTKVTRSSSGYSYLCPVDNQVKFFKLLVPWRNNASKDELHDDIYKPWFRT